MLWIGARLEGRGEKMELIEALHDHVVAYGENWWGCIRDRGKLVHGKKRNY